MPTAKMTVRPGRRLVAEFSLSPIEQDILLLAVAPEIDLKYETLFAYLNNDITRKWPTFDLALRVERCGCRGKGPKCAAACRRKQSSSAADCCNHQPVGERRVMAGNGFCRGAAGLPVSLELPHSIRAGFICRAADPVGRLAAAVDLRGSEKRVALTSRVATSIRDHLAGGRSRRTRGRGSRLRPRKRCAVNWGYLRCCASTLMASVLPVKTSAQLTRALLLQQRLHGAALYLRAFEALFDNEHRPFPSRAPSQIIESGQRARCLSPC